MGWRSFALGLVLVGISHAVAVWLPGKRPSFLLPESQLHPAEAVDWDVFARFGAAVCGGGAEPVSDPSAQSLLAALRPGAKSSVYGYALALRMGRDGIAEQLLIVPDDQYCVHVPPPPPHLMVVVEHVGRWRLRLRDLEQPVIVRGHLECRDQAQRYGRSSFRFVPTDIAPLGGGG